MREWTRKKFLDPRKAALRQKLSAGEWSHHLVLNEIRHREELEVFDRSPLDIIRLKDVLDGLKVPNLTNVPAYHADIGMIGWSQGFVSAAGPA